MIRFYIIPKNAFCPTKHKSFDITNYITQDLGSSRYDFEIEATIATESKEESNVVIVGSPTSPPGGYQSVGEVDNAKALEWLTDLARPGWFTGVMQKENGTITVRSVSRDEPKPMCLEEMVCTNNSGTADVAEQERFGHLGSAISMMVKKHELKDIYLYSTKDNEEVIIVAVIMPPGLRPTATAYDKTTKAFRSFEEVGYKWVRVTVGEICVFCLTHEKSTQSCSPILHIMNTSFLGNSGKEKSTKEAEFGVNEYFKQLGGAKNDNYYNFDQIHLYKITPLDQKSAVSNFQNGAYP